MEPSFKPLEISLPVPRHPHLNLHAHLTFPGNCAMIHLTTTEVGEGAGLLPPMGSFVYAMPNLRTERDVISTPLSSSGSSIDYATRMAKILARRMKRPVYLGCSMNFAGITADEEMEGVTALVESIMSRWNQQP